ncbi:alpha/beta fold hydrolase [Streptomyces sp. NPDC008313]|uniref:alpha/beta fold hydrolase n=1 Tax=Streptomyces sp. NPDC008313 TaxID=3364826 RepID=UPI0036EA81CC
MSAIEVKSARPAGGPSVPYAEAGSPDGIPLVLVHGLGESWWTFEPLLRRLPASLHGYAPTQRGHGDAARPDGGYAPHDLADDLVAFLDTLGIGRAVLAGSSTGGVTARIVAGSHPDRVAGLVLMGTPATVDDHPRFQALRDGVRTLEDPVPRPFVEEQLGGAAARAVGRGFLETMTDEGLKIPARVWRETVGGLMETDLVATLRGILVPTLVLWGDEDPFLPAADQQRILDLVWGSTLIGYDGGGHALHWEQPERVAQDIAAFAAESAAGGERSST